MTLTKEQMDFRLAELNIKAVSDMTTWERMNGPPPVKAIPISPGTYVGNINMHADGPLPTMNNLFSRLLGPVESAPMAQTVNMESNFSLSMKPPVV
ncbi:MAG: hypothetical protein ACT4OY_05315 [Alphaproteobacteria bacterium]